MIFKTFDTNIDKMGAKWGIFGKSFNEIGQAIKGRIGDIKNALAITNDLSISLKNSPSIWERLFPSKESIQSRLIDVNKLFPTIDSKNFNFNKWINKLNEVDKKVKANITSWQDYSNSLDDNKKWIAEWGQKTEGQIRTQKDMIAANQAARQSALDHNAALQKQTLGAKAAEAGLKALKLALNTLVSIGITYAISFIITKFDEIVNAVKNGVEKINNLDSEIKSINSEIKDLNDKLSETKIKINELEKLPKLTFLQEEELEALKAYNDELERQRRERENEERSKQQEKSNEAEKLFNNLFSSTMGTGMSRETAVQLSYSAYKTLFNDYEKLKNEINKIKQSDDYQSDPDKFENTIRQKENELRELDKKISEQYTNWQTVATNLNPYNDYTDKAVEITQSLIDKWDALSGKVKTTLTDILNDSQFAVVKKSLDDLATKGELTVDKFNSLTEKEVTGIDRFREALKNVENLTVEDAVESINQEIKDSAKDADNTADGIKNLSEAFEKLYDSIDDVISKQEKLADAFKKTRLGAKLTIQELYELIKEMPSLAQYASKEGDGYTISAEGFEAVSKENDNIIKEQIAEDLETTRENIALLEKEQELQAEKDRLYQQWENTGGANKNLKNQYDEVVAEYEDVASQCQNITSSIEDLTEYEKSLVIINDLVGESFNKTSLIVDGANEAFEKAKTEISGYNSNIQTIDNAIKTLKDGSLLILITILTQDKIIVKMVITPEALLTN